MPVTWTDLPVTPFSHALDLTATRSLEDELAGLEEYASYCRAFRDGVGKDYSDLHQLGCVRRAGSDRQGNPLYIIAPGSLLADSDLARVRRYALQLLAEHAREGSPFSVLFLQNNVNPEARQVGLYFVYETYRMLPRALKRNLRMLGVVHPTNFVRSALLVLSPFLADSFWDKLNLVERLDFADAIIGGDPGRLESLEIPLAYFDWDRELEQRASEDADALRSGAMYHGGAGMGGVMGGAASMPGSAPPR
ncbi:divergent CRAL/TRIO domain-containing protein [Pavlovales sp. CCMP2436]|nr:divergent CRAL/TRIO domain-containing protein [Pavlovales sp. CCMP2436]